MRPSVALLGFGEVGQVLGLDLAPAAADLKAFDLKFDDPGSAPARAASASPVTACGAAAAAVGEAQVVISAVTVDQALNAAGSAAAALQPNTWYLDLNSASPEVRQAQASVITEAGGRYVEAAVMSPINPQRLTSPILLGGEHAQAFQPIAQELGFTRAQIFSKSLGKASAAKLCRSVIVKGMECLVAESLLAARYYDVDETVLASLDGFLGSSEWEATAPYLLSRILKHGQRRAAEMRQAADTVAAAAGGAPMSLATAQVQDALAALGVDPEQESWAGLLDTIRRQQPR